MSRYTYHASNPVTGQSAEDAIERVTGCGKAVPYAALETVSVACCPRGGFLWFRRGA